MTKPLLKTPLWTAFEAAAAVGGSLCEKAGGSLADGRVDG